MKLHEVGTLIEKRKRRLGQGHGSGRVKTSGRGTKGQNARSSRSLSFEGGALPLKKRLPFLRGKNRNKAFQIIPAILNVSALNSLPKDTTVDAALLVKQGLVSARDARDGIKILGNGKLTVSLKVALPTSQSAAKAIEKAGGSLVS
jgi:large subunit ribosomal protein L15